MMFSSPVSIRLSSATSRPAAVAAGLDAQVGVGGAVADLDAVDAGDRRGAAPSRPARACGSSGPAGWCGRRRRSAAPRPARPAARGRSRWPARPATASDAEQGRAAAAAAACRRRRRRCRGRPPPLPPGSRPRMKSCGAGDQLIEVGRLAGAAGAAAAVAPWALRAFGPRLPRVGPRWSLPAGRSGVRRGCPRGSARHRRRTACPPEPPGSPGPPLFQGIGWAAPVWTASSMGYSSGDHMPRPRCTDTASAAADPIGATLARPLEGSHIAGRQKVFKRMTEPTPDSLRASAARHRRSGQRPRHRRRRAGGGRAGAAAAWCMSAC